MSILPAIVELLLGGSTLPCIVSNERAESDGTREGENRR